MDPVWETALAVIGSVGGGATIVAGCSAWLGRLWADRLMAQETARHDAELAHLRAALDATNDERLSKLEHDLTIAQSRTLDTVREKLAAYRYAIDLIAGLVSEIGRSQMGRLTPEQGQAALEQFERERLRLYGYLGMLAPQPVMNAQDRLIDWLLGVTEGSVPFDWKQLRGLALVLLNEIRRDVGLDKEPIAYKGTR